MNAALGWSLAFVAVLVGWFSYGAKGLALAVTVIAFWLLLQFNRSVRVMRHAAESPVGHVPSAVMLMSKLRPGLPMLQVVSQSRSLGKHVGDNPETWSWSDDSGAEVRIVFDKGRCSSWELKRPEGRDEAAAA